MKEAGKEQKHGTAAVIGIGTLLFGASTVFAQLQYSLNRIWNVEAKPGKDVWDFVRRRLLSKITQALVNEMGRPLTPASHARLMRSPRGAAAAAAGAN